MVLSKFRAFAAIAIATIALTGAPSLAAQAKDSSPLPTKSDQVYSRIIETKTIRAAWLTYPPAVMKDPATGKLTGTFVDALEEIAHNLGLHVEWMPTETSWADQIAGLDAGRFDIIGSPVWANPTRGKLTTLSNPVYYSSIGIYVRSDDSRFGGEWVSSGYSQGNSLLNRPDMRIATLEGETGELIAKNQFPLAKRVPVPKESEIPVLLDSVLTGKADAVFVEPYFAVDFLKEHPGKIKNVAEIHPVRVLGNVYMFKKDEFQLKQMIDVALEELENSGEIDRILEKYENEPGIFPRVQHEFVVSKQSPAPGSGVAAASINR